MGHPGKLALGKALGLTEEALRRSAASLEGGGGVGVGVGEGGRGGRRREANGADN